MATERDQRGQIFTVEDGIVVVEWYDFGEDVAFEFAVQLRFDPVAQHTLATALGLPTSVSLSALLQTLEDTFSTYHAVRVFADKNDIPYELRRDLMP